MNATPSTAAVPNRPATWTGLLMRLAFFAAAVYFGAFVLENLAAFLFQSAFLGATLGTFVTGLFANFITLRIFERASLADIGLGGGTGSGRNFFIGLALSTGCGALLLAVPLLVGAAHIVPRSGGTFSWLSLVLYLVVLLFGAAGEETIFRGYGFQVLIEKLGAFAAILPVALIFGLAHAGNPHSTKLALLNTVLWGILLGFAFVRSRDLWLPIGLHYGWNALLPLFGTNLSGITIEITGYSYRWDLTALWSGGDYGLEGGLLATIFITILFFVLAKVRVTAQVTGIARSLNEPG